jgi:hypothetical protein
MAEIGRNLKINQKISDTIIFNINYKVSLQFDIDTITSDNTHIRTYNE